MVRCPQVVGACVLDVPRQQSELDFEKYYLEGYAKDPSMPEDKLRDYAVGKVREDARNPKPPKGR